MHRRVYHASIIIDDPLLRENYGFLNYRKLLSLMDRHNFSTTIAFIPWNYNRTDEGIAALFRERPDRFSLCVHGCDHTRSEFGATDATYLENKVKLATARMVEHEKRTGIPFDRIMVFPQGVFSNEAMEALRKNRYLAAVNTEATPVNGPITSDLPFFLRHRPEDAVSSLSDPIFIVLHHDYFQNGYGKLADLVDQLNGGPIDVEWDGAGNIVRRYVSNYELDNCAPMEVDLSGLRFHGRRENIRILARRYASEFRDNHLYKHGIVLKYLRRLKNAIEGQDEKSNADPAQ